MPPQVKRPAGVTALSFFFTFGMIASGVAAISLAFPGGFLEPIWRLNPRSRESLGGLGPSGVLLMALVCGLCAYSALGLWKGLRSGRTLAITMLAINAVGDIASGDMRTLIGLPIAAALILYLTTSRVRMFFGKPALPS
jgi:hypothetical protein